MRMIVEHHRSWYRFASKRWVDRRLLLAPDRVPRVPGGSCVSMQAAASIARRLRSAGVTESCG
jgi:hypothetical protein